MAQRSSTTFAKRQKEQARREKQQRKLERRLEKRNSPQDPQSATPGSITDSESPSGLLSETENAASTTATHENEGNTP